MLADLGRTFRRLGIDWYLFGAQAAALRGLRRVTVDVDVTAVGVSLDGATIARALRRGFALRVRDPEAFARATRVLPLVHRATGTDVDLVLGGPGLESWFLDRAETLDIDGVDVRVPLAEDLVTMKLISGRERDIEDVLELIRFDPQSIDLARVRELLSVVEEGVGEAGFVAALDRIERRLAPRPPRPSARLPPKRRR